MKVVENCGKYADNTKSIHPHLRELVKALVKAHLTSRSSALNPLINEGKEYE